MNQTVVVKLSLLFLAIGLCAAAFGWGWHAALGFAAGGAFSLVNYQALHRVVSTIGTGQSHGARGAAVFFALRYLVMLAVGYVIVRVSETSLKAAMAGLFVSIAAVLVASLYELYAGT